MPSRSGTVQTDPTAPQPLADWLIAGVQVDRAPAMIGLTRELVATAREQTAIAEALELTACTALSTTLTIHARAGGRYTATGRVSADIEQACVVTLDPVHTHIDAPIDGEFMPPGDIPALELTDPDFGLDSADEPLAIVDGQLPVGQLVFEHLALAIDPFPRIADAATVELEGGPDGTTRPGETSAERPESPFAVLSKLKDKLHP